VISQSDKKIGYVEQVLLLALVTSLIALSIDAMLPALSFIERDLQIQDPNGRQYIIGALFAGMAFGMLFYGPISDSLGRKRPIYVGFTIFLIGCLLSIFSPNYELMLFGRFLQGLGAAGPRVVSMAMIRDEYEGRAMAKFMSLVMTVFILVPVLAPAIGQLILYVADWRGIFWMIFALGAFTYIWFALRQQETLAKNDRLHFSGERLFLAAKEVVTTPVSLGYTILSGFVFSGFLSYLAMSQQIFQDQYGVGDMFPVYFGTLALAIGGASLVNSTLVMKLGMQNLITKALWALCFLSASYLVCAVLLQGHPPLWSLMLFLLVTFFCFGILFGNMNAMAMEPLGHIAGVGSAIVTSVSTLQSAILGTLIAQTYDGTILPLVISFTGFGVISLMVMYITNSRIARN